MTPNIIKTTAYIETQANFLSKPIYFFTMKNTMYAKRVIYTNQYAKFTCFMPMHANRKSDTSHFPFAIAG